MISENYRDVYAKREFGWYELMTSDPKSRRPVLLSRCRLDYQGDGER
jgi:hypothetical protein